MENAKVVSTPLPYHLKLIKEMCPKIEEEEDMMFTILYALVLGILMYATVYTRLDITHLMGVVSRCMSHLAI